MKYETVVIDPPWTLTPGGRNSKLLRGDLQKTLPYKTMSDEEIEKFPIDDFASAECNLFIWTTHKKLPFAVELIKKWGFNYYSTFTWVKNTGLTLQGVFRNSEFVIFGYRGKYDIPFTGKAMPTAFNGKTGKHSEKPNEFYDLIKDKTQSPRIDLFARKKHDGFTAWGDEIEPTQNHFPGLDNFMEPILETL